MADVNRDVSKILLHLWKRLTQVLFVFLSLFMIYKKWNSKSLLLLFSVPLKV